MTPEPIVSVGAVDGANEYLFSYITACVTDTDENIFVADTRQFRVSVFSKTGVFLRSFGSEGTGPGEFKSIRSIRLTGDTLRILDNGLMRIVEYDTTGNLISTTQMQPHGDARNSPDRFYGNYVVTIAGVPHGFADAGTVYADTLSLSLYSSDGTFVRHIAKIPDQLRLGLDYGGVVDFPYLPLGTSPSIHGNGSEVVFGQGRDSTISVLGSDGVVQTMTIRLPTVPVTAAMRRDYAATLIAEAREERRDRWRRYLELVDFPAVLPRYDKLRIDESGNIWVHPYSLEWNPSTDWSVLDRRGRTIATVTLPKGFSPEEIRDDSILGVARDEDGFQFVQRYALRRR